MECTFCDYYEATLQIMMMMESMPTPVCDRCVATLSTPYYVIAESDTSLV